MRKLAVLLSLLMLCALPLAAAEGDPFEFPNEAAQPDPFADVPEGISLDIGGASVPLMFDSSAEYSSVDNGTVQASFYAYSDENDFLYELYMIFPDTVESGTTVTPDYAMQHDPDCSVVLIVSSGATEQYFFAGQIDGAAFPNESGYSIRFDSVENTGSACVYSGSLTASLVEMELDSSAAEHFSIENAPFSFTMPLNSIAPDAPDTNLPEPRDDFTPDFPKPTQKAYKV